MDIDGRGAGRLAGPQVSVVCLLPEGNVSRTALRRTNLVLEIEKVRRLRKALRSRSNSEAVRLVIDERLAAETGLQALRNLQKFGGLEDVFNRAPAKKA
jgi:hypothetical protein